MAGGLAVVIACSVVVTAVPRQRDVRIIVGKYKEMPPLDTPTPAPRPATATPASLTPQPAPRTTYLPRINPLAAPMPVPAPVPPVRVALNVPKDLHFFLVIGSDARHYEDMTRARADSIHIAAVDPKSLEGTILGIPRDSYVDIPGHGKRKINAALPLGGPNLLVQTVRNLTRMPISHYALTGFHGIDKIVDTLKGVDVYVPYDMDDDYSGAHFKKGMHHMNGVDVLAFSRARHGVPGGDFGRSKNHGSVIKYSLRKMRAETKTKDDLKEWLEVLFRFAKLDMSMSDALELAVLARTLLPADLSNIVAPGKSQMAGDQSVVMLGDDAKRLFDDVAMDAVADGDTERNAPKKTPEPRPKVTPTPTPAPTVPTDVLPSIAPGG